MENITFLIGNGFDINVGLKTSYSEFYKFYTKQENPDALMESIKDSYDLWSDLEIGLGKYTEKLISEEEIETFFDCKDRLESTLAEYLKGEMKKINISEEMKNEISEKMQKSLSSFESELPKEQKMEISNLIYYVRDNIEYNFISFNYTDTLDQCVQIIKEKMPQTIARHTANNQTTYSHTIGEIVHVHGTTQGEMILGVNDENQIENKDICRDKIGCQCMIKSEANKHLAQNKINTVFDVIDFSVIICVFGMSLGDTDKMWWEYICKWLNNGAHRLIIFVKKEFEQELITTHQLFKSQWEILDKLKKNSGMSDDEWNQIEEKIYIKFNSKIFDFKLVS